MKRILFVDLQAGGNESPPGDRLQIEWEGGSGFLSFFLFKRTSGKYELERVIEPLSGEGSSSPLRELGIETCYLSLPLDLLRFRVLQFPFSEPDKLRETIPFELEGLIMEGSEGVIFDSISLGGSDGQFDVLVPMIKREALKRILARLASLDIDPQVITSIDLRSIVRSGAVDMAKAILETPELDPKERIDAAREELRTPTINLRTGPFAYTKQAERMDKVWRLIAVLSICLALLIHADLIYRTVTARHEIQSIQKEIRGRYVALFPEEKKISDELYQMKSHLKEMQERGNALFDIDPLQFLMDLSERTMPSVKLHEITVNRDFISLKGEADAMSDIDKIKAGLKGLLKDISVSEVKPSPTGKFIFALVAKGRV